VADAVAFWSVFATLLVSVKFLFSKAVLIFCSCLDSPDAVDSPLVLFTLALVVALSLTVTFLPDSSCTDPVAPVKLDFFTFAAICSALASVTAFWIQDLSTFGPYDVNILCNVTFDIVLFEPVTINELDAMYKNIMPPLQIETFENSNRTQYSKKDNKEPFKNMGSRLVELTPSITPGHDMVVPPQQHSKKDIKENLENTNLAQMSPSSMMMGFTRSMETNDPNLMMNSKETFSNMDMGIQIQKQQVPNMNMDMTYSNKVPSMMSASMMTPPPKKKQ
jgi:hypothetical protein